MRTFITVGFGEPIGRRWLELAAKVASGVRQDIPNGLHEPAINRLVKEIAESGMRAIFILGGWLWANPDGTHVRQNLKKKSSPAEIAATARHVLWAAKLYGMEGRVTLDVGSEINGDPIYKHDLRGLEEQCHAVWQAIQTHARGTPMIAGSISNVVKRDGLKRLARWLDYPLPPRWWVGVHPYRSTARAENFTGFASPLHMRIELRDILAGRKFAISEMGWHDVEQTYKVGLFGWECWPKWLKFIKRRSQFSRAEVATFARWEIDFWRKAGAELFCWYQIRDGLLEDPNTESHYGAYDADGTEKLVAASLARGILA